MANNDFEKEAEDVKKQTIGEKVDLFVDSTKEAVEKSAEFVGDAAKTVGDFADSQLKSAKKFFNKLSDDFGESKLQKDLEKFKPIFAKEINSDFHLPKMISVVDYDKRMQIEACKGAVGYQETVKNVDVTGIYEKDAETFGIDFYPTKTSSVYYVHPLDEKTYIQLSEYFTYLKEARIAELKRIAQALGAKHFKVTIEEQKTSEFTKKDHAKVKLGIIKNKAGVDANKESGEKKYEFLGIASESYFNPKEPERPELKFWAKSETIKNLIEQRLSKDGSLTFESFKLDYNTLTGITESEAAKIDGVLKALKFDGAGSITEKAKEESRKRFEYIIEF